MEILSNLISGLICPKCYQNNVTLSENLVKRMGSATLLDISCPCGYKHKFYSSKKVLNGGAFDVNRCIVYASRSCGMGQRDISLFSTLMNMPPSLSSVGYNRVSTKVALACREVARESMQTAAKELKMKNDDDITNASISFDGSWQKRGYSSLNGFVAAISIKNGKVLDVEPMSRYCKGCVQNEHLKKSNPMAFREWQANHICMKNTDGFAGGMEVTGGQRIFNRSIDKYKLWYSEVFSDGDSKTYQSVKDTYKELKVIKKECVGHVQKRVGSRLRNLKKRVKGLGGRSRLTDKTIDRLQNFYGIAVRSNKGNLKGMQTNIMAALCHVSSSSTNEWHDNCPKGSSSWCGFKRDCANGTKLYKPGVGIHPQTYKHVKPVFVDLCSKELLERCLDCQTQNANESLNGTVWKRLPKTTYVGFKQFEFGLYDAVAIFNEGRQCTIDILEKLGMEVGVFTMKGCSVINTRRISEAEFKMSEKAKKQRKVIRGRKKGYNDKAEEKEGVVYGAGLF